MTMPGRYEAGVGCLVVVAAGLLAFMALQVGAIRGLGEHIDVVAVLDSAAGLSTGAVVSIAGVSVGRVSHLEVDFDKARVRLSLDADAQVRNDATLVMRARSVLGEKYLEIVPNSRDAPLLADNDVITNTKGAVEIDQLVTRMAPLVEALDPEALRMVGESLSRALAEDPDRPARMLADAERALENAANASEALPGLVGDARATLASVKKTSDAARPVIVKAEGAVSRLDALVASVPPEELPALVADLRGAVKEGRAVITRLDGSSVDVAEILAKLNNITADELSYWAREEGVLIRLIPKTKAKK
ncbi:MAG: MlaD family protein [Pseudomonadota bacterium]|nr:MlaD family protein [Pseudomonadota bacterium]